MAEKLYMIALSPTMTDGVIARWKLAEGAAMKPGVVVCEVETDKATMDYEAPKNATLLKIVVPQGGKAAVGDVIGVIGAAGESPDAILAELAAGGAKPATGAAPGVTTATSAQSAPEAPAPALANAGPGPSPAPVSGAAQALPAPALPLGAASASALGAGSKAPLAPIGVPPSSPLARARARELGVDIRMVSGSGPEGRVVVRDVEEAARSGSADAGSQVRVGAAPPQAAIYVPAGSALRNESVAVAGKRAVIARRLAESFFQAPHFYLKKTVDVGRLLAARQAINEERKAKLSLNAWLMKLAALAISRHPTLNAGWKQDAEGKAFIEYRASVDIGLAVALPDGLITPVVRDCLGKGVAAIDTELAALIAKAKASGLAPEDYTGATFTITNLGSFGIDEFTAIINPPGSAILAVGASRKEPFVKADDSIGVRTAMTLSLGCDHRVVDGAVGAAFLADLCKAIEEPLTALL